MALNPRKKIKPLAELAPVIEKLKKSGKKVVLAHGIFDLLHYGHIHYLQQAKRLGDILVVSSVIDKYVKKGPNRPMFNEKIRENSLAALGCVDYVVPCHNYGPWDIILAIKPDIYAKGEDSALQLKDPNSGLNKDKKLVESVKGQLVFTRSIPVHSTDLLKNFANFPTEVSSFLDSFKKTYPVSEVIRRLEDLRKLKVVVIGEAIIDEYRYVAPLSKPTKSHIISTQYLNSEEFAGGVLACANHVASICDRVDLVTYLGEIDSREDFIRSHLKPNVRPTFFYAPGQPTIVKRRFLDPSHYYKFFEECIFDQNYLPDRVERKLADYLHKNLDKYDLAVVVDYGHGFLSRNLINLILKKNNFLAVNTQTNSGNTGFNYIVKYPNADYACIDEIEARLAAQDNISDIKDVTRTVAKKLEVKKMVVTLGHRGSIAFENGLDRSFKLIPSLTARVTDPVGAGDAFLAMSSPCAAAGFPLELVSFIGNVAGSIAVGTVGNKAPVERDDLFKHISYLLE